MKYYCRLRHIRRNVFILYRAASTRLVWLFILKIDVRRYNDNDRSVFREIFSHSRSFLLFPLPKKQSERAITMEDLLKKNGASIETNGFVKTFKVDLANARKDYDPLNESRININVADPLLIFKEWFTSAQQNCKSYEEANAMALSTASRDGRPSCRMLLLKGFGSDGFRFFTSYSSRKAQELEENPFASMMFYWPSMNRSIRIEGRVEKLLVQDAEEYWAKRPVMSQASAFVSDQSRPILSRKLLEDQVSAVKRTYVDESKPIPKPENWGGYILIPDQIEFWHGCQSRLHDRVRFRKLQEADGEKILDDEDELLLHKGENGWYYERLQP